MEKLDELFETYKKVFIKREDEIKQYLLKYKREDFIKRDVIDIKRIDATERLKTSGFSESLAIWQNFYKNVIVSACIDKGPNQKRFDYKFYFTEEKIDSELLEKVEDIIKEANKLTKRNKFEDALSKVDIVEDLVREKQDRYFNEQLRILRKEIKDAEQDYYKQLQKIETLEEEVKKDRKAQSFDSAIRKCNEIIKIADSIRKKDISKNYEDIIEEIQKEKTEKKIADLEEKVKINRDSARHNVAIKHCEEIIKLARSIDHKDKIKEYESVIEEIKKEIEKEREKEELDKKLTQLQKEFKDAKKRKNYDEAFEISLEIIQLAAFAEKNTLWEDYSNQKDEIVELLEEKHKLEQEQEVLDEIEELQKKIEENQAQKNYEDVIDLAEEAIKLSTSIRRGDITNQYTQLIEDTKARIRARNEEEKIREEIRELEIILQQNREKKRLQNAVANCEDIIKLSQQINDERLVEKYSDIKTEIEEQIEKERKGALVAKTYDFNWDLETTGAILTCNTLKTDEKIYLIYGGHDKKLFLLDQNANLLSSTDFDGWVRCSYSEDFDTDGIEEVLAGTGDGNMLVLKLDEQEEKLQGIFHQKSQGKILCCCAGDLNRNGIMDFVYGLESKKVKIYEGIESKEPKFILYYSSWVTSCAVGALKLSDLQKPIMALLVGTQEGILQLVHLEDDDLEIIWQRDLSQRINDIKVADITNDGYNEIIVACDDSHLKILNSEGDRLKYIRMKEGRPLTLCVDDIDNDGAQELIVGGSHGKLSIYQTDSLDSLDIKLKWKTTGKTSIQSIITLYNRIENKKQIIYGGYDRKIQSISDFEWGKRKKLDIKKKITLPKVKKAKGETEVRYEVIHTNLREFITELFQNKFYLTIDALVDDLVTFGYKEEKIREEILFLKENDYLIQEKPDSSVWTMNTEKSLESRELAKTIPKTTKNDKKTEKKDISQEKLQAAIISHLNEKKVIKNKSELVNSIIDLGFNEEEVEEMIDILNEQDVITYSRSKPQGWMLKT
ncbi:MAG: hypothetical protein BAJALOKI1v1_1130002 [Promethearchaeota archaeon]|nr:MAG: hypothetical protein BAJALOKI1v1_1130002 [Candidatus Lokiarchaeota archaeon]